MRNYSLIEFIWLIFYLVHTKIFFRKSRIVRFPIYIKGKRNIDFGKNLTTGIGCRIETFSVMNDDIKLKFGENVQLNDYVHITAMNSIIIGDNVLMASKIYISDCLHGIYKGQVLHSKPTSNPMFREYYTSPVKIGENVWIGEGVSILPGVTIGSGAIIGANSVVSKSIPSNCIAVGTPARPIKIYNEKSEKWERI